MLLIQMTGLSGAGKTTISRETQRQLAALGYPVEVVDGDEYRRHLCSDLGFSRTDRLENIRRLGVVGLEFARQDIITILAAINPYEEARRTLRAETACVRTVYIQCSIEALERRDVKGLYARARLPEDHAEYIGHFTGISDPYEVPECPDLTLETDREDAIESATKLVAFILRELSGAKSNG